MKAPIRISASRLKTLWSCSLQFYYQEILGLPENVHWKTKVGSCVHSTFECIMRKGRPSRLAIFSAAMVSGTIHLRDHPSLIRFVNWQLRREGIDDKVTVDDIEELLRVAFLGIRPYFITTDADLNTTYTPPPDYRNEQRFQMTLPSGAVMSGFIDLLLLWPDRAVCIDLKTQAKKFPRDELPSNVQATIYQLATFREHGLIPTVDFVLVRHAPTTKTPDKHIQRVAPPSEVTLAGLIQYIDHIYVTVNQLTYEQALACPNPDEGFCLRVCTHYAPHPYWEVCAQDDSEGLKPLSKHLSLDKANEVAYSGGHRVIERRFQGCAVRWNNL
jgi:hypothetical protein